MRATAAASGPLRLRRRRPPRPGRRPLDVAGSHCWWPARVLVAVIRYLVIAGCASPRHQPGGGGTGAPAVGGALRGPAHIVADERRIRHVLLVTVLHKVTQAMSAMPPVTIVEWPGPQDGRGAGGRPPSRTHRARVRRIDCIETGSQQSRGRTAAS